MDRRIGSWQIETLVVILGILILLCLTWATYSPNWIVGRTDRPK